MTDEPLTTPEAAPVRKRRSRAVTTEVTGPDTPVAVAVDRTEVPGAPEPPRTRTTRPPRTQRRATAPAPESAPQESAALPDVAPVARPAEPAGDRPAAEESPTGRRPSTRRPRGRSRPETVDQAVLEETREAGAVIAEPESPEEAPADADNTHAGRARRRRRRRARARGAAGETAAPGVSAEASEALAREIAGTLQEPGEHGTVPEAGTPAAGRRRRVRKRRRGKTAAAGDAAEGPIVERPPQPARPPKANRTERKGHKVSLARRAASMGLGTRRWSERWTDFLEYVGLGPRLKRGLEYARQGAVHDARMDQDGVLTAKVKGSLPEPYRVTFALVHLEDEVWKATLREMADNAWWSTELLRGELPDDIDAAFAAAGASLYPTDGQEVLAQCTCPDLYNPCKHIAAVFYWLAGQFDKDPFILFRFRGRTREQVLQALTIIRSGGDPDAETIEEPVIAEDGPLEQRLDDFWTLGTGTERLVLQSGLPAQGVGNHLIRLDQPAGWEGRMGFILTMGSYFAALEQAEDLRPYFGTEGAGGPS
ncbi:MAG: SWIM zinc finger family protein [Candidatus Sericytochromatia bacterium]|nr:SWIM zinc finger family protein [Candidatus Tanganyikabacteria bacterium]